MPISQEGHPAEPTPMICEHPGCNCHEGKDYVRKPTEEVPGWKDEPIFLCDEHKGNHIPSKVIILGFW